VRIYILKYSVRRNSLSDTAHVCGHRSGHLHYTSEVFGINRNPACFRQVLARRSNFELVSSPNARLQGSRRLFETRPLLEHGHQKPRRLLEAGIYLRPGVY